MEKKFQYIPSLDVLRGFAVLLVLMLHGSYGYFKGGWVGVDLFFVISGYLITTILLNENFSTGKIAIFKFYVRRALRLFPALIICVLLSNILWSFTENYEGANRWQATIAALFYFTNFIPGNISGNMAHLWSLAVEEHFYLFWPVLISFFLSKLYLRYTLFVLTALILAITAFRICAYHFNFQFLNNLVTIDSFKFTLCRIDSIILGAILAFVLIQNKYESLAINFKILTFILVILLASFIFILFTVAEGDIYLRNGGFIITNLICVLTVWAAVIYPNHFLFSNRMLHWLGKKSYGIYLYHFPIFMLLEGLRVHHSLSNYLIVTSIRFIATIIVAELSYRYVELPFLKSKKRFESSKSDNIHNLKSMQ